MYYRYMKTTCEQCQVKVVNRSEAKYCSRDCSLLARLQKERDPNFWDDPTVTEEFKFYYLGLIWADGCLSRHGKDKSLKRVSLNMGDLDLMKSIHEVVAPNRKMYVQRAKFDAHADNYSVITTNKKVVSRLEQFGLTERKSYSIVVPNLDDVQMKNFTRGYFDGDGSIWHKPTNGIYYYRMNFTSGSKLFLKQMADYHVGYDWKLSGDSRKTNNSWYLYLNKQDQIKRFCEYMYSGTTWKLDRKNKFKADDIV